MTLGESNPLASVSSAPPSSASSSRASGWIISAGVFVVNLDLFIVNVAVPALGDAFEGSSLASLSWVLNAYAIVFAALLVVAGRLADRYGHRRGFLLGLAVFTVASGVGWLVAARALQAAGAAGCLLFACGLAWWAIALGAAPHYASGFLPGMVVTGIGVGLALPTLVGAAAAALPPTRFATGSAVTTMARQTGSVLGVALMVTLIGAPDGPGEALDAFRHGWWAAAATAVLAAFAALTLHRRDAAPAPA
ncbi:MFS transporter [Streptomyces sp. NPDC057575]|uniref:MFS transporter n=1 Tax=unclassified Streptomyces TaxID=2593676 RepID=UPI0036B573DE